MLSYDGRFLEKEVVITRPPKVVVRFLLTENTITRQEEKAIRKNSYLIAITTLDQILILAFIMAVLINFMLY
jgi:hypothetical protein